MLSMSVIEENVLELERQRNPHLIAEDVESLLDELDYSAPPRPRTIGHVAMRRVLDRLPGTDYTWDDLVRFREDSLATFEELGFAASTMDGVRESARWVLADRSSPLEVGAVEAKFDGDRTPLAVLYRRSPATSFPRPISDVMVQGGVDHLTGHLTLGVLGLDREDEENACLLQYMAARQRALMGERQFRLYATAMVPALRLHKRIPGNSFSEVNQRQLQRLMIDPSNARAMSST